MNYMKHLVVLANRRDQSPQTTNLIVLYTILIEYNNKIGWDYEWFTVANSRLIELCGFNKLNPLKTVLEDGKFVKRKDEDRTPEKILERARNELKTKGYIGYKKGSPNQAGSYSIVPLGQDERKNVSQGVSHRVSHEVSQGVSTLYKLNQTKLKVSTSVDTKGEHAPFEKPTVEEIEAYCTERKNSVDPNRFYDYYESNGWRVGKNKMEDWKSAVRTWETNQYGNQKTSSQTPRKYSETSYDLSELEQRLFLEN